MADTEATVLSTTPRELPSLTLQVVGSFLPPRLVTNCRLVCKQWRAAFTASVKTIHAQVYLDVALTDHHIAAAAAVFPAATCAILHLPNRDHLICNVYDSVGDAVTRVPLGRRSTKLNRARLAVQPVPLQAEHTAAAGPSSSLLPASQPPSLISADAAAAAAIADEDDCAEKGEGGRMQALDGVRVACAAALVSLRRHFPGLRALRLGDGERPVPRRGPLAELQQCLHPEAYMTSTHTLAASAVTAEAGAAAAAPISAMAAVTAVASPAANSAPITAAVTAAPAWSGGSGGGDDTDCEVRANSWRPDQPLALGVRSVATALDPMFMRSSKCVYPSTLLPPEGAVAWEAHSLEAAQNLADGAVAAAHRAALDLTPLLMPAPSRGGSSNGTVAPDGLLLPPQALASLDLRCAVDLTGFAAAAQGNGEEVATAVVRPALASQLTALTVLQLRDGGQLAALRPLTALSSLDLWCCDGCNLTEMAYWTSAAPQRVRRGLVPLAAALTALTALALRELAAQVEPPPPVAALAALPLLRSLTLELVYSNAWEQLSSLVDMLGDEGDEGTDVWEAEGEKMRSSAYTSDEDSSARQGDEEADDTGDEEEEEEEEEEKDGEHGVVSVQAEGEASGLKSTTGEGHLARRRLRECHQDVAQPQPWRGSGAPDDDGAVAAVDAAAKAAVMAAELLSSIERDAAALGVVAANCIDHVVEKGWRPLRDMRPMDLFSCFTGGDESGEGVNRSHAPGDACDAAKVASEPATRGSLTHLDVSFVGAGLLPGAWHSICQLGGSLTHLALRVGRSAVEERLVASLLKRDPGRWPPGSFSVPSLEALPNLRHLLLDAPLEPELANQLTACALTLHHPLSLPPQPQSLLPACQPHQLQLRPGQQRSSPFVAPPHLESLTLDGVWTTTGVACPQAVASSSSVPSSSPQISPLADFAGTRRTPAAASPPMPPLASSLRCLHLDGNMRYMLLELAAGVLRDTRVVDLRLSHRPEGRPAQSASVGPQGRLPLDWAQLPQCLEALEVQGFDMHASEQDSSNASWGPHHRQGLPRAASVAHDAATPYYNASANASSRITDHESQPVVLPALESLQLRHCSADLAGVSGSPLGEVAVLGCWLVCPRCVIGAASVAATWAAGPTVAVPPWDTDGQVRLLCAQPWAPRLRRLELQMIRAPEKVAAVTAAALTVADVEEAVLRPCSRGVSHAAMATTAGTGAGAGFGSAPAAAPAPASPACTSCLCDLRHLSITWELEALSKAGRLSRRFHSQVEELPRPPPLQQRQQHLPPDRPQHQLPLRPQPQPPGSPMVGLTPAAASRWVAALPGAGGSLRSLELYLGDQGQEQPLAVEDCWAPWLQQLVGLRRLRLVLCVSADRDKLPQPADDGGDEMGGAGFSARSTDGHGGGDGGAGNGDGCCEGISAAGGQDRRGWGPGSHVAAAAAGRGHAQSEGGLGGKSQGAGSGSGGIGGGVGAGRHSRAIPVPEAKPSPAGLPKSSRQPPVPSMASAWMHAELADLFSKWLPYCQSHVVQVRI